jgi:tRNA (guanine-N7-)-methyltransferase
VSDAPQPQDQPRLRLYGRRKGKRLRKTLQAVLDRDLLSVRIDTERLSDPVDPALLFDVPVSEVWFEIGFGAGEHLAAQAENHPDIGAIGAEIFENGIASLLRHRDERGLTNIRILTQDAREFLPRLSDGSLKRVYLLYPDPWPKRRHAKRRFISQRTLDDLARLIPAGGEFRVATDHPVYARWCLRHIPVHPAFHWEVIGPQSWRQAPKDAVVTRYEEKAVREGRTPMYLNFLRV